MKVEQTVTLRTARASDLSPVLGLLKDADLPTEGVVDWLQRFLIAESNGRLAGAAGLEIYEEDALLRSVVVAPEWRGRGVGAQLIERVIGEAERDGLRRIYLLTTTAEAYFPRHGFRRIAREDVSAAVQQSQEFTSICPATAAVMVREMS